MIFIITGTCNRTPGGVSDERSSAKSTRARMFSRVLSRIAVDNSITLGPVSAFVSRITVNTCHFDNNISSEQSADHSIGFIGLAEFFLHIILELVIGDDHWLTGSEFTGKFAGESTTPNILEALPARFSMSV